MQVRFDRARSIWRTSVNRPARGQADRVPPATYWEIHERDSKANQGVVVKVDHRVRTTASATLRQYYNPQVLLARVYFALSLCEQPVCATSTLESPATRQLLNPWRSCDKSNSMFNSTAPCHHSAENDHVVTREYIVFGAPFFDQATIDDVADCLRSGWIGTGPKVARFEERVREYTGAEHAVALNSCTAALHLSLIAAGIGEGDEVITTPMTFCATANAIVHSGARPVFVDCDRRTQLIDLDRIEAAITPRTRAIMPVHFAGRICDMTAIGEIARRHGLLVIEDAAHAIEGRYDGRKVGAISDITCFSFYVTKNVTTGEGGMVTTNDPVLAGRIKTQALHGMSRDAWARFSDAGYKHYEVVEPGFKYNMMDLHAAIGLNQFDHVDLWLDRRNEIWRRYEEEFKNLPVGLPAGDDPRMRHARHLYTLMIDRERTGLGRDDFIGRMHERNVGTGVHYVAVHLHPWYRETFGLDAKDFPNATWISERTVSLPITPHLSDDQVSDVIHAVGDSLEA